MNNTQIGGVTPANGTFLALTATGTATFSPAGASVAISPTAGGTVTINPAGAGTINNMAIGGSVAAAAAFTTVAASGSVSASGNLYAPTVYAGWPNVYDHYLTTDANYTYYFRGAGWNDVWRRSDGLRLWQSASATAMTLTGAGVLTTYGGIVASGNVQASGAALLGTSVYFSYPGYSSFFCSTGGNGLLFQWQSSWYWQWNTTNGTQQWVGGGVILMSQDGSGGFSLGGNGYAGKPGGGAWSDTSDIRIKTVQGDYLQGLDAINQLRPVAFTFKGNDTPTADFDLQLPETPEIEGAEQGEPAVVPQHTPRPRGMTTAPYNASPHYHAAVNETVFAGFVAQELETIFPEMVSDHEGYIDGVHVTDLKHVDTSPLIFALVNAVKELSARVVALEGAP
jgi:hypothetical protein